MDAARVTRVVAVPTYHAVEPVPFLRSLGHAFEREQTTRMGIIRVRSATQHSGRTTQGFRR